MEQNERSTGRVERFVRALMTDSWIRLSALAFFAVSAIAFFGDPAAFLVVGPFSFVLYVAFALSRALRLSNVTQTSRHDPRRR